MSMVVGRTRRLIAVGAVVVGALTWTAASAGAVSSGPTGTVVSTAASPNGRVLVVGSGPRAGFALYLLTSDVPPKFGCTTTVVTIAPGVAFPCAGSETSQADWPALTSVGRPVAGPGVRQSLLGTVKRADLGAVQVTYAGHPLYLFDPGPAQFTGADIVASTVPPDHGVWYLVSSTGAAAAHLATVSAVTLQSGQTVLGAAMNVEGNGPPTSTSFPVYTYSRDSAGHSACTGACAVAFPPLLTSGHPQVAAGGALDARALGSIARGDGTRQVTYRGKPLYLNGNEAYDLSNPSRPFTGSPDGLAAPGHGAGRFTPVALPGATPTS